MRPFLKIAFAGLFVLPALHAQQDADPGNLKGERVQAQDPADTLPLNHGAAALQQLLLKLRTRASMMFIVAHPDDEDGGLLTYESRGQGARVAMLTLTRGEGGQNLMSADFDDALGLIRTQELLAEDRYTGVDQFFGTEVDFGFSKTKEEAFAKWTHERVLYDAVRAVRLYRPLVLASVFVGGPTDGHGHHQVSGEICQEVFTAAADPKIFPEMGLPPWAPLKVYARVPFSRVGPEGMFDYATGRTIPTRFHNYVTGVNTTREPTASVLIHEGDSATIDGKPALGMEGLSYVQFARKGLALQKSQIGGNVRLAPPGKSDSGYTLMASRLDCEAGKMKCPVFSPGGARWGMVETATLGDADLFAGIDTSLLSLAGPANSAAALALRPSLARIDASLAEAQRLFDPADVEKTAPALRSALGTLDLLIDAVSRLKPEQLAAVQKFDLLHELKVKRAQLNDAVVDALTLTFKPRLHEGSEKLIAGQTIRVDPAFSGQMDRRLGNVEAHLEAAAGVLAAGEVHSTLSAQLAATAPPTRPYFSRSTLEQPYYNLADANLRNSPLTPSPLTEVVRFTYDGAPLEMRHTVEAANGSAPALVVPAYQLRLSNNTQILAPGMNSFLLGADVTPLMPSEHLSIEVPSGFDVHPHPQANPPDELTWNTSLIDVKKMPRKPFVIPVSVASADGHRYTESFRSVGYAGIPYTNMYTPARLRVVPIDVGTAPGLHVAYLPGTGDTVPDFLPGLGVTPSILSVADLNAAKLAGFDVIVLGVRAYAAHAELSGKGSQPLLDFAARGGVVIVQYNTARYGDAEAPYPISTPGDSAHNVVEEAQPVKLLQPENPLLTWPNRLSAADFDGWVAERGHGFAASWDAHYLALLETNDVDQDPQKGGLLLAPVGKGAYIYCALALYRQLPEAVPGAYRLLANLLSYAKNPKR